jgi:alpha-amylase
MLGSFVEDRGRTLRMFPLSEALRYHIPFQTVEKTIAYLKSLADEGGDRLVVYGDDTEKFGGWPGTHEHVYTNGWLERFLAALERTLRGSSSEALRCAQGSPRAKIYLPDASYREMTEWPSDGGARVRVASEGTGKSSSRARRRFPRRSVADLPLEVRKRRRCTGR